jgi:hypothetical protein
VIEIEGTGHGAIAQAEVGTRRRMSAGDFARTDKVPTPR